MESVKRKITEREKAWIEEFFRTGGNASRACAVIYGGTVGSVRVKGCRKKRKFEMILEEIKKKGLDGMECGGVSGVRFYLGDLERRVEERRRFMEMVNGTKGLKKLLKLVYMS